MMLRRTALAALVFGVLLAAGCGGQQQQRKLLLGESCASAKDSDCGSGLCLRLDSKTAYCTQACDATKQDCPQGLICQNTANPAGDHCVLRKAGAGVCASDNDCPSGFKCDVQQGQGTGVCYIPVSRGLCAPCQSSLQCPTGGECFKTSVGEQFCTQACDASGACPTGYDCTDLGDGNGKQCVPHAKTCSGGKPLCSSCRGDAECGGYLDLCVQNLLTGEKFCGTDCKNDPTACPTNFTCEDLSGSGDGPFQCVPNSTTCQDYCDADPTDIPASEAQCGFGRMCDNHTCVAADDGRLCAPCANDDQCRRTAADAGNLCIRNTQSNETFCGRDCTNATCPLGFSCIPVTAGGTPHKQCVPTRGTCTAGTGRLGDDCSRNGAGDCLTGLCLDYGQVKLCSASCTSNADCSAAGVGYGCCSLSADGSHFDCSTPPSGGASGVCAPTGGNFGDDCTPGQPPCHSGMCLDIGTARLCTQSCQQDSDCPQSFHCEGGQDTATGDSVNICFPAGGGGQGADCTFGPAACASRLCIKSGAQNICTVPCKSSSDCSDGWTCDPNANTVDKKQISVCVPPQLAP